MADRPNNFKDGNFTVIPNIIDELDISPLAKALYLHYRRWDAASRRRSPSVKQLKAKYRCGAQAIEKAKAELKNYRLITIDSQPEKGFPDRIQIVDIWQRNFKHFERVNPSPVPNQEQVTNLIPDRNSSVPNQEHEPFPIGNTKKETNLEIKNEICRSSEWEEIKLKIEDKLNPQVFKQWFPRIECSGIEGEAIRLITDESTANWVDRYYSKHILEHAVNYGVSRIEWSQR